MSCPSALARRGTKMEQLTPKSEEEMYMSSLGRPNEHVVARPFERSVAGWRPALTPVVLVLFVVVVLAEASAVAQGAETYAEAYRLANQTGRPMVVLVGAEWCGPCRNMKQT